MKNKIVHHQNREENTNMNAEGFSQILKQGQELLRSGDLRSKNSKAVNIALQHNIDLMTELLLQDDLS